MHRARAAALLVPLVQLAGCVPPAPLQVVGQVPEARGSYALVDDTLAADARAALARNLLSHGLSPVATGRPGLLVDVALADRPLTSGSFVGETPPRASDGSAWIDRPHRRSLFAAGRREIRLTIRFMTPAGASRGELVATEVVGRRAPPAVLSKLIDAAFATKNSSAAR